MLAMLSGIGSKVWGYVLAAGIVLASVVAIFNRGKRSGQNEVSASVNAVTAGAAKRMSDAAVQAPSRVEPVAKDMEKGKF